MCAKPYDLLCILAVVAESPIIYYVLGPWCCLIYTVNRVVNLEAG